MISNSIFLLILLPILAGLACLFLKAPALRKNLTLLALLTSLGASLFCFFKPPQEVVIGLMQDYSLVLGLNSLSSVILIFINLFGVLVCLYSGSFSPLKENRMYFSYLAWLVAFSSGVCLARDFITFIFAWGAGLALLYALLKLGSGEGAQKALSVVGFGDFSFILGACLYITLAGTTLMPEGPGLPLDTPLRWFSFVLMLFGAFSKAGCGPFHTWIPTASETTPLPIMAILPASLDKLLGIYLLARVCVDFFVLSPAALVLLLLTGALTIIFAVLMALIQHDLRKLLAYHAISQVGYMVLGFGTGNILGIAGGLFHMVNHALYKSGLFLTGASVGEKQKTFELKKLGGLALSMPITFVTSIVFALSISGVPPFNGFASKWLLYQGLVQGLTGGKGILMNAVFLFALLAAMFGSVLTLASFIKFIHAIFLGEKAKEERPASLEVAAPMKSAVLILAGLCVLLGVIPKIFLGRFIEPWLGQNISFIGTWNSVFAFVWICAGLFCGFILFKLLQDKNVRYDSIFIGGEPGFEGTFPATEFYRTVEEMPVLKGAYRVLKLETLDLYNLLAVQIKLFAYLVFICVDRFINLLTQGIGYLVLGLSWSFRKAHTGVLDLYLVWSLGGLLALFFILMGR